MNGKELQENRAVFLFRHYASPPWLPGSVRHHLLSKAMIREGCDSYIFPSNYHHMLKKNILRFNGLHTANKYEGVNYIWLRGVAYDGNGARRLFGMAHYGLMSWLAANRFCKDNRVKPRIVIGSIAHSFAALSACLVAKSKGAKFWLDIGDLWPEGLVNAGTLTARHPLTYVFKWISDYLYREAELIIVLNPVAKKYFIEKGAPADKIVLFPNGTEFREPHVGCSVQNQAFRIVYTGSLSRLYPIKEAIIAISRFIKSSSGSIVLEIIGNGPDKEKLKSLAEKHCPNNVVFTGVVPKSKLPEIYRRADALLLIEKDVKFGFPNKLIDYLSAAKPIILAADNHYDMKENMAIKTKPCAMHLYNSLEKLTSMTTQERTKMGINGYQFGKKNYDVHLNFKRLLRDRI